MINKVIKIIFISMINSPCKANLRLLSVHLFIRVWSASSCGCPPSQEEEDSGRAGVASGGVAMAVLAAEWSKRSRLRLCPHRPEVGSDGCSLL